MRTNPQIPHESDNHTERQPHSDPNTAALSGLVDGTPTESALVRGDRRSDRTGSPSVGSVLPLYTPTEAARLLSVRESWLRRRATARAVPCTVLGKHLRFSHDDVVAIALAAARAPGPSGRPGRGPRQGLAGRRRRAA